MRIRAGEIADAAAIARLLDALGHPTSESELIGRWVGWARAGNEALVAVDRGGAVVGVAVLHRMHVLHRPHPVGRITALLVDERLRGQGIGRALVTAAEQRLAASGCGMIEITSNRRLIEAHAFYEHIGYERTSHRFSRQLG